MNVARQFMRVPVRIDDDTILSDLLLEANIAAIGVALEGFNEVANSVEGKAFAELAQGISAGQIEEVGAFHQRAPFSQVVGVDLATAYVNGFAGMWEGARVLRRYALGPEDVFVWDMQIEGRSVPRGFRIAAGDRREDGSFWLEDQSTKGMQALKTVITEAERLVSEGSAGFVQEAAALGRAYRREVPGTTAAWRFDGVSTDWDAFGQDNIPAHPAAAFYSSACAALESGNSEDYASHFSPISSQRFREWVTGMGEESYAGFVKDTLARGRRVVFFLDAAPATLVFYLTTDGQLSYETLYTDPMSGNFQLVSFYMYGFFDNLLQDVDFFQRPVILPIAGGGEDAGLSLGVVMEQDVAVADPSLEDLESAQDPAAESELVATPSVRSAWSFLSALLIGLLLIGLVALVIYLIQKQK